MITLNPNAPLVLWFELASAQDEIIRDALQKRFPPNFPTHLAGVCRRLGDDSTAYASLYQRAVQEAAGNATTDRLLHEAHESMRAMLTSAWDFSQGDIYRPDLDRALAAVTEALGHLFNRLPQAEADETDRKTDAPKKPALKMPRSPRVLKAINYINDYRSRIERTGGIQPPRNAILSEHLSKPVDSKAVKNLDSQVQKYRALLKPVPGPSSDD